MTMIRWPDEKIPALPDRARLIADAEQDIHGGCASLMLLAKDLETVDQVLDLNKKILAMRAALDAVASFVLAQGDLLTGRY